MKALASMLSLAAFALVFGACGGGGGSGACPVVIPEVAVGNYETDCQNLCARAATETICTAKHSGFCVDRCRAN